MSRTAIWLLGLISLAILIFLCVRNHTADIQQDILNRTGSSLSALPAKWAKVAVEGRNVILTGIAPSEALREKAVEMAGSESGVVSVDNQLTVARAVPDAVLAPAPVAVQSLYKTQFIKNASRIILRGLVPDEQHYEVLLRLAEEKFGAGHVVDQLYISSGSPKGWRQAATLAIANLALFNEGRARVVGSTIYLSGRVADKNVKNTIETALKKGLPENFNVDFNLNVPQLAIEEIHQDAGLFCAEQFNKKMTGQAIHFSNDSVGVKAHAQAIFDKILEFAASCPNSVIEVAGYTDSLGSDSYNLWLSRKRAKATMRKLIKKGMRADRLKAKGYGEENPLSGNDSRKGRANNRRIEFNYLQEGG